MLSSKANRALLIATVMVSLAILWIAPSFPFLQRNLVPLLPPLVAIGLAMTTRNVIVSLFSGIYVGAVSIIYSIPDMTFVGSAFSGMLRVADTYILNSIVQADKAAILLFSVMIGGMVGVVSRSGGLQGLVDVLAAWATSPKWAQLATFFMGIVVFFDDYANTLIVGNTFRSLSDKARVSREKLSFLVDATAAPVASLAAISTWIGYEVGLIQEAFDKAGIHSDAYVAFLGSLSFRFYAVFLLVFIIAGILMSREFGPMLYAERRARSTGQSLRPGSAPLSVQNEESFGPKDGTPHRWYNAVLPIALLLGVTLVGLYLDGKDQFAATIAKQNGVTVEDIFGSSPSDVPVPAEAIEKARAAIGAAELKDVLGVARSSIVLTWGSLLASLLALGLVFGQGILTLEEGMEAWMEGAKSMFMALIVLCLAWGIGDVVGQLKAADVVGRLIQGRLSPSMLPALLFVTAAAMSFATGTAWGTMGIMFPLSIPLAVEMNTGASVITGGPVPIEALHMAIGAILTGAIFGDHCSPISDTTILSAIACSVDLMDHVTTQIPYALVVGVIAVVLGYIPAGMGVPTSLCFLAGSIACVAVLWFAGSRVNPPAAG